MNHRRRLMAMKQDNNLLKTYTLGWIDTSGNLTYNSTYPYSYYYNEVLLEKGKTYAMEFEVLSSSSVNRDSNRFRIYTTSGGYLGSITPNNQDTLKVKIVVDDNNQFYYSPYYTITPSADRVARIMIVKDLNTKMQDIKLYEV